MSFEDVYRSLKIRDKLAVNVLYLPLVASVTSGAKATLTKGLTTAAVTVTAADYGTAGNDISLTIVDPGVDADLSVVVTGNDIVVNLKYVTSAAVSTAAEVSAAINAATDIVVATHGGDGTGTVLAAAEDNLEGGADVTEGAIGSFRMKNDYSEMYIKTAEQTWKRIQLAALG